MIQPLTDSNIPIFSVLGNHDYGMATETSDPNEELAQDVKTLLQEMGALMTEKEDDHIYGWIDNYGASGNQLYINPGIGFSTLPLRINCPPEITLFTLKSA